MSGVADSPRGAAFDDGQHEAPEGAELVGQHVHGRYLVLRELGWGSLGRVYQVRDRFRPAGADLLALKVVRRDRLSPETRDFLKSEFRFLSLLRHPHIARVHDLGVLSARGELFFTLEYVPGRPLTEVCRSRGWTAALPFFVQALRTLAFVHARGVIHMDLKAQNVLVVEEGNVGVKLLDFHLACEPSGRPLPAPRGTVATMSPEVIAGRPVDARADLYSLGAVFYEALCGRAPFADAGGPLDVLRAHMERLPPRFAELGAHVPAALEAVVFRLLAKDPGERFASAEEAILALNAGLGCRFALETEEGLLSSLRGARLVARGRQLEDLAELARGLMAGGVPPVRGAVVLCEEGGGRSRFLDELRVVAQLEGLPAFVLRPAQVPGPPYAPFLSLLAELGRRAGDDSLFAGGSLRSPAELARRAVGRARLPSDLEQTAALAGALRRLARSVPFVVCVDDVERLDPASAELLRALLDGPPLPALLVLAVRAEDGGGGALGQWGENDRLARVELPRLTPGACARLLGSMLGAPPDDEVVGRVWEVSEGLPGRVEEIVRGLAEAGALRRRGGVLVLDEPAARDLLAAGQRGDLAARRLEALGGVAKRLLAAVAASPRPRPLAFARAVARVDAPAADEALRALVRRGLVTERGRDALTGAATLLVEHEPLRRAALRAVGPEEARALHARAARLLESRHPASLLLPDGQAGVAHEEAPDRAEELLWHLERSGALRAAVEYAERAGDAARARGEQRRARALYATACALADRLPLGEELAPRDAFRLRRLWATALARSGGRPKALELLAGDEARALGDVEALLLRARLLREQGDLAPAGEELEAVFARAGSDRELRARAQLERAVLELWRANYPAARRSAEAAASSLEALAERSPVAREALPGALQALHHACHFAGDEASAREALARACALGKESGGATPTFAGALRDPLPLSANWERFAEEDEAPLLGDAVGAHVPQTLGEAVYAHAGRGAELSALYDERVRLLEARGDEDAAAFARLNRASLRRALGRVACAVVDYREAREAFARGGHRLGEALARLGLGRLLAAGRAGEEAEAELRVARSLAAACGCSWLVSSCLLGLAEAGWVRGRRAEAWAALTEAEDLAGRLGNVPQQAELALTRAAFAGAEGDEAGARAALARFRAAPRSARSAPLRVRAALVEVALPGVLAKRLRRASGALATARQRGHVEWVWRSAHARSKLYRERGAREEELADLVTALEALRDWTDDMPASLRRNTLLGEEASAARNRFEELRRRSR